MNIDYSQMSSVRKSIIKAYNHYVEHNDFITEDTLFSMPVVVMVGYFLTVHSKTPEMAVRRYLKEHYISYRKANEVKLLINIFKIG